MKYSWFLPTFFFFCLTYQTLLAQYGNQCLSGDCINGTGVLSYGPKVGKYDGEFKGGKRDGFGTMYYADGRKWEGQWKKDAFKQGITTTIPYHKSDSLRPEGVSDANPFIDALYRIISSIPDNFKTLKGTSMGKELEKYEIWQPKIMLPTASKAMITSKNGACTYYFVENTPEAIAEKAFTNLNKMIQDANPRTWNFDDLSYNPAFPYHRKLYKWTIAIPATIRLEMKQSPFDKTKYDVFIVFTP